MRVANYYRVSTKLQTEGYSLSAQKEELNKYIQQQNWNLIDEFKDVESGGKLEKDGLNALLDTVEEGRIDVVLCIEQDRLSRLDTVSWEYLKNTLRENKVKIAEPGILIDLDNEDDVFISDIKNLIAQREKRNIVKKMMRGKRQRLREGKGWGMPPFEYTYNKNTARYEAKEEWRWVIPFIDDLYLNKQLGMVSIANELNKISKTPTGNAWNENLVHRRIHSTSFHGIDTKDFKDGGIITTEVYEPLRTEETYNKLQIERENRKKRFSVAGRSSDNIHMLRRSYLTCGECGRKIRIANHGTRERSKYYATHGRRTRFNGELCRININTRRFDKNITTALKEILTSEELAQKYIKIDHDEESINKLKSDVKHQEKSLNKLNQSADKLLDLYLTGEDLTKELYLKKKNEIESRIKIESDTLDKLKRKLKAIDTSSFTYENLYQYMEIALNIDADLTDLEKAQLVGNLFPTGILYKDKLILITEVFNNIPIEVTVDIGPPFKAGRPFAT